MNPGTVVVVHGSGTVELRVDAGSIEVRRELGVVAWSVLEVLALGGAVNDAGRWMVYSNARDLAGSLGIGKDRAAAALADLRRVGLIVAHVERDQRSARFARSRYEVRIPVSHDTDTALSASVDEPVRLSTAATRSRRAHAADDTPNLFDQPT